MVAPFSELLRSLPYIAIAGFVLGFIGSWVKPVADVDTVADHLQFGVECAAFYLVLLPVVIAAKRLWDWMWSRAGF